MTRFLFCIGMEYFKGQALTSPPEAEADTSVVDPDLFGDEPDLDVSSSLVWIDEKVHLLHSTRQQSGETQRTKPLAETEFESEFESAVLCCYVSAGWRSVCISRPHLSVD